MSAAARAFRATLVLPLPPNRANRRGHWAAQYRQDKAWALRALVALRNADVSRPRRPLARCRIAFHVVTTRAQDYDNAVARTKPATDLLVREGWLRDDGPAVLVDVAFTQAVDARHPRLEVTIEDAP